MFGWFEQTDDPHVVLLHIGTNDAGGGNLFTNAVDRPDALITRISLCQPSAHLIVTTLIPQAEPTETTISNVFNSFVPDKVASQQAQGRNVHFLDMHAHLVLADLYDGLHPSAGGYAKMAAAWFSKITNVVTSVYDDGSTPALCRAVNLQNLLGVQAVFSKPLNPETATNLANYALSGGVTLSRAALSEDNRTVTLTTSPLTRDASYTLTVNGLKDFAWPTQRVIAADSSDTFKATIRGYLANVPEAANYRLAYQLNLPINPAYSGNPVTYATNNTPQLCQPLKRVDYYMELQPLNGDLTYLWVSMYPFTGNISKLGVPVRTTGETFQKSLNNMNVVCNDPSVTSGTGLTGNIEFWPTDYSQSYAMAIVNASNAYFDFGDLRGATGGHGSMQIHNAGLSQVLFAMNNWGTDNQPLGLGIGNRPNQNDKDWTHAGNAASYIRRTLHVLIRPTAPTIVQDSDAVAPTLTGASASYALDHVTLTFTEPLSDRAATDGSFAINNGVAVTGAKLLHNKASIILTTSMLTGGQTYQVTVSGVRDRSSNGNLIAPSSTASFTAPTSLPALFASVPESAGYSLIHQLALTDAFN